MQKVVIYTGLRCVHCDWAKELLNKKKIQFTEYNIAKDSAKMEEMLNKSNGMRTVPQIFVGDQHIGGNDELQTLENQGKLDNILGL
jgi:glutaredoxin 3|tara:strand:+ start:496 stop:753 length:258 start_codon:yes stop_codon:yes gene_type:complete